MKKRMVRIQKIFNLKILLSILIFFLFLNIGRMAILFYQENFQEDPVVRVPPDEAVVKSREFCNNFEISCKGKLLIESVKEAGTGFFNALIVEDYNRLHLFYGVGLRDHYGYSLTYSDEENRDSIHPFVNFVVGDRSGEVENYQNPLIYRSMENKNYTPVPGKPGVVNWPKFMPEEKAMVLIDSLASKLKIPPDMVFERLVQNDRQGVWTAIWVRKKDVYIYEGDAISMSIMGSTGEFVGYTKTYRGLPCQTDVGIGKEGAIDVAWKKLNKTLPLKIRGKMRDIYNVDARLLIIQSGPYESKPVKIQGSKLAWIIKYSFNGGIKSEFSSLRKDLTKEELEQFNAIEVERIYKRWPEMGKPPRYFEVRIDAATGKILYVSKEHPWFLRWLIK